MHLSDACFVSFFGAKKRFRRRRAAFCGQNSLAKKNEKIKELKIDFNLKNVGSGVIFFSRFQKGEFLRNFRNWQ